MRWMLLLILLAAPAWAQLDVDASREPVGSVALERPADVLKDAYAAIGEADGTKLAAMPKPVERDRAKLYREQVAENRLRVYARPIKRLGADGVFRRVEPTRQTVSLSRNESGELWRLAEQDVLVRDRSVVLRRYDATLITSPEQGVNVRYDVSAAGPKESYDLPKRPEGDRLTWRWKADGVSVRAHRGEVIAETPEGERYWTIGKAVLVDSSKQARTYVADLSVEGDQIVAAVDPRYWDAATFPVVVDPTAYTTTDWICAYYREWYVPLSAYWYYYERALWEFTSLPTGSVTAATLYVYASSIPGTFDIDAHTFTTSIDYSTVTGATIDGLSLGSVLDTETVGTTTAWYSWDITTGVQAAYSGTTPPSQLNVALVYDDTHALDSTSTDMLSGYGYSYWIEWTEATAYIDITLSGESAGLQPNSGAVGVMTY